ncbi:hypothetical protein AB0C20_16905, partial [Micromonospora sp. NPDC048843]
VDRWNKKWVLIVTDAVSAIAAGAVAVMAYQDAPDDRARLRVVIDQVASLTDPAAVTWHTRLVGKGTPPADHEAA